MAYSGARGNLKIINGSSGSTSGCHAGQGLCHEVEDDVMMKGPTKPNVIEISEEDYKQNTVYRPWAKTQVSRPAKRDHTPAEKRTESHYVRAISR